MAGNHDHAAIGKIGIEDFNTFAAFAAQWTTDQLNAETRAYLEALPTIRHPASSRWRTAARAARSGSTC